MPTSTTALQLVISRRAKHAFHVDSSVFTLTFSGLCWNHAHTTSIAKYASVGVFSARPASCASTSSATSTGRRISRVRRTRST